MQGPPKRVQAKTFVAVGHETANKVGQPPEAMESNLLANMEMGVHNPNMRSSEDQVCCSCICVHGTSVVRQGAQRLQHCHACVCLRVLRLPADYHVHDVCHVHCLLQ